MTAPRQPSGITADRDAFRAGHTSTHYDALILRARIREAALRDATVRDEAWFAARQAEIAAMQAAVGGAA